MKTSREDDYDYGHTKSATMFILLIPKCKIIRIRLVVVYLHLLPFALVYTVFLVTRRGIEMKVIGSTVSLVNSHLCNYLLVLKHLTSDRILSVVTKHDLKLDFHSIIKQELQR